MNDNLYNRIIYGIILILIGVIWFISAYQKQKKEYEGKEVSSKKIYDERQKIRRGEGYKYAFYTLLVSAVLSVLVFEEFLELTDSLNLLYSCIIIATGVYSIYCIAYDAYFAINDNINFILLSSLITLIAMLLGSGLILHNDGLWIDGKLNNRLYLLVGTIVNFSILVTLCIKKAKLTKEDTE